MPLESAGQSDMDNASGDSYERYEDEGDHIAEMLAECVRRLVRLRREFTALVYALLLQFLLALVNLELAVVLWILAAIGAVVCLVRIFILRSQVHAMRRLEPENEVQRCMTSEYDLEWRRTARRMIVGFAVFWLGYVVVWTWGAF